jgi:ABC-type multidrug transport system fused ATPase/permease subunit
MRYLDIEAKAPLYTLFTDMSSPNGLEHIRAFGWQEDFLQENLRVLDYSQGPYYYMYTIQRWLELAMDLIGLFIALILICMTTFFRQMTTQAGLGLSLLNLITYSNMLNLAVGCWTTLETSLGALARLRTFVNTTPQEASCEDNNHVPPQWPHSGHIEFVNVSAKYQ